MKHTHYLYVEYTENQKSPLYEKEASGRRDACLLGFSPTEYRNNLETMHNVYNSASLFVGYKTTVRKAIERLEKYYSQLDKLRDVPMRAEDEIAYQELSSDVSRLLFFLRSYTHGKYTLVFDQTEGSTNFVESSMDTEESICLKEGWYDNQAANNERIISYFKKAEISVPQKINEMMHSLPGQSIHGFYEELKWATAEAERGGPDAMTQLILDSKEEALSNNPRVLFRRFLHLSNPNKSLLEHSDELMQNAYSLYHLLKETERLMQKALEHA